MNGEEAITKKGGNGVVSGSKVTSTVRNFQYRKLLICGETDLKKFQQK